MEGLWAKVEQLKALLQPQISTLAPMCVCLGLWGVRVRVRRGYPLSLEVWDGSETFLRVSGSTEYKKGPYRLHAMMRAALARIVLDDTPATHPVENPFFCQTPVTSFTDCARIHILW